MMAVGGSGVISVASNIAPRPVADLVHAAQAGQWDKARALHMKYHRLFTDLFLDTNPIPIKAAMAMAGMIAEEYRLPLGPIGEGNREILRAAMRKAGMRL